MFLVCDPCIRASTCGRGDRCAWPERRKVMVERSSRVWFVAICLVALCVSAAPSVSAQITTGTVYGTVKDSTGAVVPGATVILISETKGTKSAPQITNGVGEYV